MKALINLFQFFCFLSIAYSSDVFEFNWEHLTDLPPQDNRTENPGVAGPFVGVHNDALIIAGGANFPNKPLWETNKVWHDKIYVLSKNEDSSYIWEDAGKLDRPLAYGSSVSTPDGVLCIGGDDSDKVYTDVFLLSWDQENKKLSKKNMPDLPEAVGYGSAALHKSTVYLIGGQTGKKLDSSSNKVWTLDLTEGESANWKQLPLVPWKSRAFLQVATQHNGYDDCIYVIGGRREEDGAVEFLSEVWEYNLNTNEWRERKSSPYPIMAGTAIGFNQSHIAILGGADGSLWEKKTN